MSIWTEKARKDGERFYQENPDASCVTLDSAAPLLDPCRRAFQEGFLFAKRKHEERLDRLYSSKSAETVKQGKTPIRAPLSENEPNAYRLVFSESKE